MASKRSGDECRVARQIVGVIAVVVTLALLALPTRAGETITLGGKKYEDATIVTNSKFLSIVHASGIKRVPWDKVPANLKAQYPQPAAAAAKSTTEDAATTKTEGREESAKSRSRSGSPFGRTAPSVEDLTKRYRSDVEYAKQAWTNERDPKKKRVKKAEYNKVKKRHDKAVQHYKTLLRKYGDDKLAAADEWRATIGAVVAGKDKVAARAAAKAKANRIDYRGQVDMAFYGKALSKKKMYAAITVGRGQQNAWDSWNLWKLGAKLIWLENAGSTDDVTVFSKRKLWIKASLHLTGEQKTIENSAGKPMKIPVYRIIE